MPSPPVDSLDLLSRYRANPSPRLRDRIVAANMGLVRQAAHRWAANCREPYDDLEQVGAMGLCKAVESFDLSRGFKFSTFAMRKIISEIQHYIRDKTNPVRVPRKWQDVRRKLLKLAADGASIEEMAALTRIPADEIPRAIAALQYRPLVSLDQSANDNEDSPIQVADAREPSPQLMNVAHLLMLANAPVLPNGYFNATEICKTEHRHPAEFLRLPSTVRRIKDLEKMGKSHLFIVYRGRRGRILIHQDLAPDFLCWVNRSKYEGFVMGAIASNLEQQYSGS